MASGKSWDERFQINSAKRKRIVQSQASTQLNKDQHKVTCRIVFVVAREIQRGLHTIEEVRLIGITDKRATYRDARTRHHRHAP